MIIAMRLLMDSSSLRRLELMELLNSSDNWWTVEEISLQLNCSVRSVKADIYYYNTFSSHSIKLVTSNHRGVKLILPVTFQMESIYQEIVAENINSQMIECLYQEKMNSIEEYADHLFTSTSSIIRGIKHIDLFLRKYKLTVQKNPMRIIGTEKQIRFFYGVFFWEKYGAKIDGTVLPNFNEVNRIIQKLEERTNIVLSPIRENRLSICLLICFERISKGYILQQYTAPVEVNKTILEIIEDLIKDIPLNIPKQEIEFIGFYFANRFLDMPPQLNRLSEELRTVFQRINQFLTEFSEKNHFIIPNKGVVQRSIFHYVVYKREFRGCDYFLVNRTETTLLNIDKIYHPFIKLVISEVEGWTDSGWKTEVSDEVNELLYLLIIHWEGLTAQILHLQEKIKVLIISQFGKAHELFLADILMNYFPNELECFSLAEKKFQNLEIEVVVTDTQVDAIQKLALEEVTVIGIEYMPNERNWNTIRSILIDSRKNKEKSSSWANAYTPFK